jgi:hypothetical protein
MPTVAHHRPRSARGQSSNSIGRSLSGLPTTARSGGRQANLRRFLADSYLRFAGLDYLAALRIGALLGETGTGDVVDAAVVVCARELGLAPVITSDPQDLRKLDPALPLIVI